MNCLWEGGPAGSVGLLAVRAGLAAQEARGIWMKTWRQQKGGPCKGPPAGRRGRCATAEGGKEDGTDICVERNCK